MNTFAEIFPRTLSILGIYGKYKAELIIFKWREIVGEDIATHTRPKRVDRGELLVGTSNSVWAHHLMTMKEDIINKLNIYSGEKVIKDIKFQAGYFKNDKNEEKVEEKNEFTIYWKNIVLSQEDLNSVLTISNCVEDEKLREKVKKILIKDKSHKKAKQGQEWKKCNKCQILCPPGELFCTSCILEERETNKINVRKLLRQAPWLNYSECVELIPCRETDYNTIRNELMDLFLKEIENGKKNDLQVATFVMLVNKIKPAMITEQIINSTIDKFRRKKNVFTPRC